jgi:hypothetical protein
LGSGESINSLHIAVDIPPCKDKAETRDLTTDHYSKILIKKMLNSRKVNSPISGNEEREYDLTNFDCSQKWTIAIFLRIVFARGQFPGLDL